MAGAWYFFDSPNCVVRTSTARTYGGSTWCADCPSGNINYPLANWNALFPNYKIPVPAHCMTAQPPVPPPSGSQVPPPAPPPPPRPPLPPPDPPPIEMPQGPITGDPPGEPDPCAPAMAQRTDIGARAVGADGGGVPDTAQHLTMPRTGVFHSVRNSEEHAGASAEPQKTGKALYTKQPEVRTFRGQKGALITVADPAAGPGFTVFAPGDLNEFCLRGDGTHPLGKWPRIISRNCLLIMSGARNDPAQGDRVNQILGFGMPSARTFKPLSGVYFEYNPTRRVLNIQHTDADGADDTVTDGVTIDGSPIGGADEGVFTSVPNQTISEDKDDYDLLAVAVSGQYYLDPDADGWEISGIVPDSPAKTRMIRLTNVDSAYGIVLKDQSTNSDAENRIITGLGTDYTLPPLGTATLVYDVSSNRWRIDV